jgi:uncharacterized membrane protein
VRRARVPHLLVGLFILAYIAIFGTLSLRRHQNLNTNALDLGYTDQAVWNTLHGRLFRFSTYLDAAFRLDIPIQDFRQPDVLLGYHVEPILAPISLLYLLHDGPETLLWLQTAGIALGAVPLYLLARHRFGQRRFADGSSPFGLVSEGLPVAFVLIYLLAPSLEAANLSDFHAVALSPALLLAAFYCLETDRIWGFLAFALLATLCKEEIGLLVAMMGLWAALVRKRQWLGFSVFAAAAGWSVLCFAVITPHFNGLATSAFLVRYGQFGDSVPDLLRNLVRQPGLLLDWLRRPDVLRYLRDLWLSSGGLAILHPLSLVMAAPLLAINTFSSYSWMRSGGAHYSAAIVPFLGIATIYGTDWAAAAVAKGVHRRWGRDETILYQWSALGLVAVGLLVAGIHHHQQGISPLSRRFALAPVSEHARRAEPFFEWVNSLPPDVAISASSGLYPHVAHRENAYLFPTVSDAQFLLIDVTGPGSPAGVGEQRALVRDLLDYAQFGVAASDHGFLLLERGLDQYRISPAFYDVFTDLDQDPEVPASADFGGMLRLVGVDWTKRPVVRPQQVVQITTYWQVLAPIEEELRVVFYFWDQEGQLVRVQPEEASVHWFPSWLWEPGQVVKLSLPPLPVGDLPHAGVAVLHPGAGNLEASGRLVPIVSSGAKALSLWDQETILELPRP